MALDMFNITMTQWNYLLSGNIFSAVLFPYTNLLGFMFYALIGFLASIMIYIKTQDFVTTSIVGMLLLGGGAYFYLPKEFHYIIYIFIALGATIAIYKIFKG